MELTTVWFILIAVLWIGYFVLEGFDFGVGVLLPVLGHDEHERGVMLRTIGPVWDGNEVWLLTAGGATFAAFPEWYATLFSGFYLALFVVLVALIVRNVGLEYRNKRSDATWRRRWDIAVFAGSVAPALLWGVAFGNIVRGTPIDASGEYVGSFFDLLNPYALLGGLVTLGLFTTHGATFLALKTRGRLRERARNLALAAGLGSAAVTVGFLVWTAFQRDGARHLGWFVALAVLAALALVGGLLATRTGRDGWAFGGTMGAIALGVAALFVVLFPEVMPSSIDEAFSLTVANVSSTDYTLRIMTGVAVVVTPVVLAYQAWTYVVFRRRLDLGPAEDEAPRPRRRTFFDVGAPVR